MTWWEEYQSGWRNWLSFASHEQVEILMRDKVAREFLFDTIQELPQ